MINFRVLTLFPDFFTSPLQSSLLGKAVSNNLISVNTIDIRQFGLGNYKKVDDSPYGGGPGMVMRVEPIYQALSEADKDANGYTIMLAARGKKLKQRDFVRLAELKRPLNIICGHYEGIDERVGEYLADEQISIGSYVLSGGEAAALVLIDGISRLLPGFMNNSESPQQSPFLVINILNIRSIRVLRSLITGQYPRCYYLAITQK